MPKIDVLAADREQVRKITIQVKAKRGGANASTVAELRAGHGLPAVLQAPAAARPRRATSAAALLTAS
jgi:hypothetical protein